MKTKAPKRWFLPASSGLAIIVILASFGCYYHSFLSRSHAKFPATVIDLSTKDGVIGITSWRISGPFVVAANDQHDSSSTNAEMFATDYLKLAGGQESPLQLPATLTNVAINFDRDVAKESKAAPQPETFLNQTVNFPTPGVSTQLLYWGAYHKFKVIYAATDLVSRTDQDVVLLSEANSPIKIWLNDVPLIQSGDGDMKNENFAIAVHLRAGINRLLVKEMCYPLRNDFAVWLMSPAKMQQFVFEHSDVFKIPSDLIIPTGAPLRISPIIASIYGEPSGSEAHYEIRDISGRIVHTGELSSAPNKAILLSGLEDGLYSITLSKDQRTTGDLFFVGNIKNTVAKYRDLCSVRHSDELPCGALQRLADTNNADSAFHFDKQHIVLFLLAQFEWAIHHIPPTMQFDDYTARIRLIPFHSKIDGSVQYYYLYVPQEISHDEYLPLVVTMIPRPEVQTPFFAPYEALESYAKAARKYHVGFIAPFLPDSTTETLSDMAEKNVMEALDNVKVRLKIDDSRIFLAGECDGGRNALLMAENYPDIFSGVSVLRARIGESIPRIYRSAYSDNVFFRLRNLSSIPIRLVHSERDFHSPPSQDEFLMKEAKAVDIVPESRTLPGSAEFPYDLNDPNDTMFEFFSRIKGRDKVVPFRVTLAVTEMKHNHLFWITIDQLQTANLPGYAVAEVSSQNRVSITSHNVQGITLNTRDMPGKNVSRTARVVIWNGREQNVRANEKGLIIMAIPN